MIMAALRKVLTLLLETWLLFCISTLSFCPPQLLERTSHSSVFPLPCLCLSLSLRSQEKRPPHTGIFPPTVTLGIRRHHQQRAAVCLSTAGPSAFPAGTSHQCNQRDCWFMLDKCYRNYLNVFAICSFGSCLCSIRLPFLLKYHRHWRKAALCDVRYSAPTSELHPVSLLSDSNLLYSDKPYM